MYRNKCPHSLFSGFFSNKSIAFECDKIIRRKSRKDKLGRIIWKSSIFFLNWTYWVRTGIWFGRHLIKTKHNFNNTHLSFFSLQASCANNSRRQSSWMVGPTWGWSWRALKDSGLIAKPEIKEWRPLSRSKCCTKSWQLLPPILQYIRLLSKLHCVQAWQA